MKKFIVRSLLLLLLFLIIRFPAVSIAGASSGLLLWYQTVVPTLLPGMILSSLIVQTDAARYLVSLIQPLIGRLLHTSAEGTYCVLIGLLCGYPIGAKTCGDYIRMGKMDSFTGNYLMAFINYPSPMFISGYLAAKHLGNPYLFHVLLSIYLPLFILNGLSWIFCYQKSQRKNLIFHTQEISETKPSFSIEMLDQAIYSGVSVIVKIGCYMMLFSLLSRFVQVIPGWSPFFRCLSIGTLEMTTGIHEISLSPLSVQTQGAWMCGFAAFGGLSTIMQTLSVVRNTGISFLSYIMWKLLHAGLSVAIFYVLF